MLDSISSDRLLHQVGVSETYFKTLPHGLLCTLRKMKAIPMDCRLRRRAADFEIIFL